MHGSTDPWELPSPPSPRARFTIIPDFIAEMLTPNELCVYRVLASHANEYGYSWPAHATIARESKLSMRTVQRALTTMMEREGFKQVRRASPGKGQTSNGYYVPLHRTVPGTSD